MKKSLLLFCLLFWLTAGTGGSVYAGPAPRAACIRVVTDSAAVEPLGFYRYYLSLSQRTNRISIEAMRSQDGFTYSIPHFTGYAYLTIPFLIPKGRKTTYMHIYYLQPDDSITIVKRGESFSFSGKGSERMRCQFEVYRIMEAGFYAKGEKRIRWDDKAYRSVSTKKTDSLCALINAFAAGCTLDAGTRDLVAHAATSQLQKDNTRSYYSDMDDNLTLRKRDSSFTGEKFAVGEFRLVPHALPVSETVLRYGHHLAEEFLIQEKALIMERYYQRNTPKDDLFHAELVNNIQQKYKGQLRDKMLAIVFNETFHSTPLTDSLLLQSLSIVKDTIMYRLLSETANRQMRDRPVYAFDLIDSNDRRVRLGDFKGKVLIIDFWFTGCTSCIRLTEDMKRVVEHFKNDSSVVFISVSADTEKGKWLSSLKSGLYTHPESINLFTEGQGDHHPFLRYYNTLGYPRLVIVSGKGTLVSANPKRPSDEIALREFIELVEKTER